MVADHRQALDCPATMYVYVGDSVWLMFVCVCKNTVKTVTCVAENLATLKPKPQSTTRECRLKRSEPHTEQYSQCRAWLCVAEMRSQSWSGVGIAHSGVDLNLVVLQADRLSGDSA